MIRGLIFDFDGLILDTETAMIDAYGDVYAERGFAFDRQLFVEQVGAVSIAFDPWKPFGPQADAAALEERRREYNRRRLDAQPVLPGVRELIGEAHAEGLKLGVASNSTHDWVEGHLRRLELHRYFGFFGCREDVREHKPEPELYRLVVNQLGLRPCEAVALEDSRTGITAARRAGLWTVAVPNHSTHGHDLSHAHLKVASMSEINVRRLRERFAPGQS